MTRRGTEVAVMISSGTEGDMFLGHEGPWTEAEFRELPTDGPRFELLDGALLMSPRPVRLHQRVTANLRELLRSQARAHGGEALTESDVRLARDRIFVPDVVVFRDQDGHKGVSEAGQVLLAAEVVSPGSRPQDRVLKPNLYAEAGIAYYLRVEPGDDPGRVEVFLHALTGSCYALVEKAAEGQTCRLDLGLFAVEFDPAVLLEP
ncbi:Uma2 family endonuclease [Marinactinospora rubrisoli]|uniref:Uma2 family endonuclease n=1 Tax=Marinactinospora rubrisoli TaxID=2715399 RepID=A0ABW2KIY3_9ACTN